MPNQKFVAAALLGTATGLRCLTPIAAVTASGRLRVNATVRNAALIGAAGELFTDKLPWTPNRTTLVPYSGRIVCGALCGWSVAGGNGALIGSVAATQSTLIGFQARRFTARRGSKLRAALREDAVALAAAGVGVAISR